MSHPIATTPTDHAMCKRGRGCPKGSASRTSLQERPHRLGRPPGTGYLQKVRALGIAVAPPKAKRPIGRPPKQHAGLKPVFSVPLHGPLVCSVHFRILSIYSSFKGCSWDTANNVRPTRGSRNMGIHAKCAEYASATPSTLQPIPHTPACHFPCQKQRKHP